VHVAGVPSTRIHSSPAWLLDSGVELVWPLFISMFSVLDGADEDEDAGGW
jgi:hypothetical protein